MEFQFFVTSRNTYSFSIRHIEKSMEDFNVALIDLKINKENLIIGTAKAWYYSGDLYGGEI